MSRKRSHGNHINQSAGYEGVKRQKMSADARERGKALHLVKFRAAKQGSPSEFFLGQEAIEFLKSLKPGFSVVSIVGNKRTGKSTLCNRLVTTASGTEAKTHSKGRGFPVGNSIQPCTHGLWLYTQPLMCSDPKTGETYPAYIVDTEGFASHDVGPSHDAHLFAIAMLMSSFCVYNTMRTIDKNSISNLSLVVELCKHIRFSTAADGADKDNDSKTNQDKDSAIADAKALGENLMPNILFVIRDFFLKLEDKSGGPITPGQYLSEALGTVGYSEAKTEAEEISALLRAYFPAHKRDCLTMVKPVAERDLTRVNELPLNQLDHRFTQQLTRFLDIIQKSGIPKKTICGGSVIGGTQYIQMVNAYLGAINTGKTPVVKDVWSMMSEGQCLNAASDAQTDFIERVQCVVRDSAQNGTDTIEALRSELKECARLSFAMYSKRACGSAVLQANTLQKLKARIDSITTEAMEKIEADRVTVFQRLGHQLLSDLVSGSKSSVKDIEGFVTHVKSSTCSSGSSVPPVWVLRFLCDNLGSLYAALLVSSEQRSKRDLEAGVAAIEKVATLEEAFTKQRAQLIIDAEKAAEVAQQKHADALKVVQASLCEAAEKLEKKETQLQELLGEAKAASAVHDDQAQKIKDLTAERTALQEEMEDEATKQEALEETHREELKKGKQELARLRDEVTFFKAEMTKAEAVAKHNVQLTCLANEAQEELQHTQAVLDECKRARAQEEQTNIRNMKTLESSLEETVANITQKSKSDVAQMAQALEESKTAQKKQTEQLARISNELETTRRVNAQKLHSAQASAKELKTSIVSMRASHDAVVAEYRKETSLIRQERDKSLKEASDSMSALRKESQETMSDLRTKLSGLTRQFDRQTVKLETSERKRNSDREAYDHLLVDHTDVQRQFQESRMQMATLTASREHLQSENMMLKERLARARSAPSSGGGSGVGGDGMSGSTSASAGRMRKMQERLRALQQVTADTSIRSSWSPPKSKNNVE